MVLALLDSVLQPQHSRIKYHTLGAKHIYYFANVIVPQRSFYFHPLTRAPPIA